MKLLDKKIEDINSNLEINSKFYSSKNNDLNINCNILNYNFYLDSHNYFPITEEKYTFSDVFSWGEISKYNNFYTNNFKKNFEININKFKSLSNIFVLGSSSSDNYYRNIMTFLPRIFFNKEKKIKLAIHRRSSNKFRNFLIKLSKQMNFEIQFVYLDDGFYLFLNSQIPQFLNEEQSINILNTLRGPQVSKREKIYITRKNCFSRNIINDYDIIDKLKKSNFRVVDVNNLSIFEQIKLFANAKVIVSATGSALTNTVFCQKDTKIIEISPKYNFDYENIFKFRYSYISNILNLNYKRIEADPLELSTINDDIKKIINPTVIKQSNYYKNLILKLEKIDEILD